MGTIQEKTLSDGRIAYKAQVIKKKNRKVVLQKSRQFARKAQAKAWMESVEKAFEKTGAAPSRHRNTTMASLIWTYLADHDALDRSYEYSKERDLLYIADRTYFGEMVAEEITAKDISDFGSWLRQGRKPPTVRNYLSYLKPIFRVAKIRFDVNIELSTFEEAWEPLKITNVVGKSAERTRRPEIEELDQLMRAFELSRLNGNNPIDRIVAFAIFSTRRLGEITQLTWDDYHPNDQRVCVRDMKNPTNKRGNHVWCRITPEAQAIIECMPQDDERIFPVPKTSISAAFSRKTNDLGIKDLRFHDLRHEGVSWIFEKGWTIPEVQSVSGHRTWDSLRRYNQYDKPADKYENWEWKERVTKNWL